MSVTPYGHPDSDGRCLHCWLFFPTEAEAIDHEPSCRANPDRAVSS